jgi:hypothetical protein
VKNHKEYSRSGPCRVLPTENNHATMLKQETRYDKYAKRSELRHVVHNFNFFAGLESGQADEWAGRATECVSQGAAVA